MKKYTLDIIGALLVAGCGGKVSGDKDSDSDAPTDSTPADGVDVPGRCLPGTPRQARRPGKM
jgi:hypothetical protein